ncbi:MAG: carboxypeptidase-like regulatory domain-containing protein [Prevotellaceae bacterium]|jgi:hypothetical protein|nr:carboxypeptidase-like regulatory domain-containing protein [Prevotellaceae bacterium]
MVQTAAVTGTVVDDAGEVLADVSVAVKGTKVGVVTDNVWNKIRITASDDLMVKYLGIQIKYVKCLAMHRNALIIP